MPTSQSTLKVLSIMAFPQKIHVFVLFTYFELNLVHKDYNNDSNGPQYIPGTVLHDFHGFVQNKPSTEVLLL